MASKLKLVLLPYQCEITREHAPRKQTNIEEPQPSHPNYSLELIILKNPKQPLLQRRDATQKRVTRVLFQNCKSSCHQ
jgi:hypothetical protein